MTFFPPADRIPPFPTCAVRIVGPGGDLGLLVRLHRSALMPLPSVGGGGDPGAVTGLLNHFFGNACPGWSNPPCAGGPGSLAEFTGAGGCEDASQSEEPLGPRNVFPGRWWPHRAGCSPSSAGRARLKPWRIWGSAWVGGLFSLCWSLAERLGASTKLHRAQDWDARGSFGDLEETAQAVCIPIQPR